ncbi:MAG: hypothetical protein AB8B99_17030 [Phormidesmis sp.]
MALRRSKWHIQQQEQQLKGHSQHPDRGPQLSPMPDFIQFRALGAVASSVALWLLCGLSPAIAQRTTTFDLDQAICANNWPEAIGLVSQLMAQDETTSAERNALLSLRRQLQRYQSENVLVADDIACDRSDPYYLRSTLPSTVQTGEPLGWENAVAEATENRFNSEVITESVDLTLPVKITEIEGLTSATPVDLSQGLNVVSGHVGQGHNVYGFVAGLGDRLEANLNVTRVMTGSLYTSDDSQLFIFDRYGNLIAAADDTNDSPQSKITDLTIPKTDLYFAVVTTYNNDPILGQDGRLTGWQDNGGGRFDYTLTLSGVTPTNVLVR